MAQETVPEIPVAIEELMRDEELRNMRNLDGWAVGTAIQVNKIGNIIGLYDEAWIELFNDDGRAGEFGGVKFMWANDDGAYKEAYAYPNERSERGHEPCYVIEEFTHPENPNVGQEAP